MEKLNNLSVFNLTLTKKKQQFWREKSWIGNAAANLERINMKNEMNMRPHKNTFGSSR